MPLTEEELQKRILKLQGLRKNGSIGSMVEYEKGAEKLLSVLPIYKRVEVAKLLVGMSSKRSR